MVKELALASHESRKFGVSTVGEAAMKFVFCWENGLALSAANTGIYVVNGRIAAQGNIIAAQIRRHPAYDYRIKAVDDKGCTIAILRHDQEKGWFTEGEASFTEADAKRAGLLDKDNYQGYPSDMYFNRALTRAMRRYAPDVFSQPVYTPEEAGARVNADGDVIEADWSQVVEPAQAEPTPVQVTATAPSLTELVATYGPEAVMTANDGRIPGTEAELAAVAAKLTGEASDEQE